MKTGKVLGIDYGDARTGLSVSDATGLLAGSPMVIREWNHEKLLEKLQEVIRQESIDTIVLGYPKNMNGSLGPRARQCEILAEELKEQTGLPVILWDERRTTVSAHDILRSNGKKEKKHRDTVDAVAACLILQGYLDFAGRQK